MSISPITHGIAFGGTDKALLNIRCHEGKIELYVAFGTSLSSDRDDNVNVAYKIDDGSVEQATWSRATSFKSAFAGQPIDLIKGMLPAKKFIIRVDSQSAGTIETYFDLDGLAEAIVPIQQACGWK